jgi:type IV secretory pathway TraG/TraD family ATPase VirD4
MESQRNYRPTNVGTVSYVEERCGRQSAYAHHSNAQQGGQVSEGRSEQGIPLLSAYDFQRFKNHEVIGFHRALPPFKLHHIGWRQYPLLQKLGTLPPPQLPALPVIADIPTVQELDHAHCINPDRYASLSHMFWQE